MFDRAAQNSGEQPRRLAGAILAYARNIDKLPNLGPAVSRMVARYLETGVKPDHYPHVAEALLPAIREVLGEEVATDEIPVSYTHLDVYKRQGSRRSWMKPRMSACT